MTELFQHSALELATMIRDGDTTSRGVVESLLARIDEVNPHLNAVVRRLDDEALAAADAADAAVGRGDALGPFHGVPFTVKENIDLVGSPTTQGVAALAEAMPTSDAPTVERMKAAGAVPLARTNLPDLGLRVHTDSSLHGLTRNPHDPTRTAGGSSGGEGSALASGMSVLGLGNDIGGSLRNPAHCCGVASIKPSTGAIPWATSIPPEHPMLASQQMAVEGPMARHVADVRAAFLALAGAHVRDPISVPATFDGLGDRERLRIAVLAEPPGGSTHPEIAAAVRAAGNALADAGHDVVEATPPRYEESLEMWAALLLSDLTVSRPLLEMVMGDDGRDMLAALFEAYDAPSFESAATLQSERHAVSSAWSAFFAEHPVVLSPTWAQPPFEHGADIDLGEALLRDTLRPVLPANFLGLPGAVVPFGTADGLPVGIQVTGDRFADLRCLDVAAAIEAARHPLLAVDPVTA